MTLRVRPFDPRIAPDTEWAAYHRFRRLRRQETDPDDPLLDDATVERQMRTEDPEWEELRFAAFREEAPDTVVGWLELGLARPGSLSQKTNGHMMWVDLAVLAPHRRQRVGVRLLGKAVEVAAARGRSILVGGTHEASGKAFLTALGVETALAWRESRLHLDAVDWSKMERWVQEGRQRSPGTKLEFFENLPDEGRIDAYCDLLQEVSNREPRGDLDLGDDLLTPAILEDRVANFTRTGGTVLRAVTVEADGALSGLTTMGYLPGEETHIHQWMTGVREPYQGRGLGKWLKAAMLLRIRKELPQVQVVRTGNATVNAPMLSINVRLGFRPYREGVEGQISLASLKSFLDRRDG